MDLTFQDPMQYCSLQHRTCFYHQSHPQLGIVFALAPSLHSFWSYFSIDLQWHIEHLLTWGVHLSVSYLFAFSYCSWGSQGKNTGVVCHSRFQWTTFCQTSPPWPDHLGWPHMAWLSFIELDKTVVRVIRLTSFLWLWFECACPLMSPPNTYRVTWVSLTLDVGYLLTAAPPDLELGVAPLGPPVPAQPGALSCRPWPWATGSSSRAGFCRVRRSQCA